MPCDKCQTKAGHERRWLEHVSTLDARAYTNTRFTQSEVSSVKIWKVIFVFQPLEVLNTTGNEQVQRAKQALLFSLRRHMIGNAQGPCGPE